MSSSRSCSRHLSFSPAALAGSRRASWKQLCNKREELFQTRNGTLEIAAGLGLTDANRGNLQTTDTKLGSWEKQRREKGQNYQRSRNVQDAQQPKRQLLLE